MPQGYAGITVDAKAIPMLVADGDLIRIKARLEPKYDMYVSDEFAADLAAFVLATAARITELERQLAYSPEDVAAMLAGVGA